MGAKFFLVTDHAPLLILESPDTPFVKMELITSVFFLFYCQAIIDSSRLHIFRLLTRNVHVDFTTVVVLVQILFKSYTISEGVIFGPIRNHIKQCIIVYT